LQKLWRKFQTFPKILKNVPYNFKHFPKIYKKIPTNLKDFKNFLYAFACQNLYARAHAKICMRVPKSKFVSACARHNLYACAHTFSTKILKNLDKFSTKFSNIFQTFWKSSINFPNIYKNYEKFSKILKMLQKFSNKFEKILTFSITFSKICQIFNNFWQIFHVWKIVIHLDTIFQKFINIFKNVLYNF
jgi:hypothetical protein